MLYCNLLYFCSKNSTNYFHDLQIDCSIKVSPPLKIFIQTLSYNTKKQITEIN